MRNLHSLIILLVICLTGCQRKQPPEPQPQAHTERKTNLTAIIATHDGQPYGSIRFDYGEDRLFKATCYDRDDKLILAMIPEIDSTNMVKRATWTFADPSAKPIEVTPLYSGCRISGTSMVSGGIAIGSMHYGYADTGRIERIVARFQDVGYDVTVEYRERKVQSLFYSSLTPDTTPAMIEGYIDFQYNEKGNIARSKLRETVGKGFPNLELSYRYDGTGPFNPVTMRQVMESLSVDPTLILALWKDRFLPPDSGM